MCPLLLHDFKTSKKYFNFEFYHLMTRGDLGNIPVVMFIRWKHLLVFFYLPDICEEGASELEELGSHTVIAKDADSKRQLTEPLKTFIYVPEPAGRERSREGEGGRRRAKCSAPKAAFEVQPSHLISVTQDGGDCERVTASAARPPPPLTLWVCVGSVLKFKSEVES